MPRIIENIVVLVIEDNPGDLVLIEEFLSEEFDEPQLIRAGSFAEAEALLAKVRTVDTILLDLTLPDSSGEGLVKKMLQIAGETPVIILTGYSDKSFSIKSLSMGISDYLFKADLNSFQLRKSIEYSLERKRFTEQLRLSEKKYRDLFHFSPSPMWVYDVETLKFLDVNEAAIAHYGFNRNEFLKMTIKDIRPPEDILYLKAVLEEPRSPENGYYKGMFNHRTKNNQRIIAEVQSNTIYFDDRKARLVSVSDITDKIEIERELVYSEQRFKALVQNGADVIAILDEQSIVQYISPTSKEVLSVAPAQMIGNSIYDFIHVNDVVNVQSQVNFEKVEDRIEIKPFRFLGSNGKTRWITVVLTDMRKNPAVRGIVANARDVTPALLAENKLKESNERYNIVAKATSDVIWDWDFKTGKIIWNHGVKKVFGYNPRELKSDVSWRDERLHPDDFDRMSKRLVQLLKKGTVHWQEEYRFRCADGRYKHVFDRGFILYDKQRLGVRIIGAMQDITQQKLKAEEREQLLQELTWHNNDLRQFSYITSHNLRAPLSNIVGLLQLLEDVDIQTPLYKELLEGVHISATQLQETIDDLGEIITIKNSPAVMREQIDLETITQNILSQIKHHADYAQPEVNLNFSDAPAVVFNKSYLESILLNLITNALKYQAPKRKLKIGIRSEWQENKILVLFSDNGQGIDVKRYKDRLFGLYQRFHPEKEGKGIGLFLVKSQMEALGGEISIQSKVGKGTEFTLTFNT